MTKQGLKIAFVNDSCEHLGVEYISAVLKAAGHDTRLFVDPLLFDDEFITLKGLNRRFDYTKKIVRDLKGYQPDIISLSVVSSFYPWASRMAQAIKMEMDVPVIMGGIHPTSVPERVILNDAVDMICLGEGEAPMLELVNSMARRSLDSTIK
ncbi:MAG TPA: cobalamin-dependent protein, partial [Candidatus Omnitrophota bacterium]|nr:cobalamin-dependent protein [Candidatus Omnitrophota bacterium]